MAWMTGGRQLQSFNWDGYRYLMRQGVICILNPILLYHSGTRIFHWLLPERGRKSPYIPLPNMQDRKRQLRFTPLTYLYWKASLRCMILGSWDCWTWRWSLPLFRLDAATEFNLRYFVKLTQTHVYQGEVKLSQLGYLHLANPETTVLRDVAERGRNIEGCIKQWFQFVKPNFERYVEPQRKVAGKFATLNSWLRLTLSRYYRT